MRRTPLRRNVLQLFKVSYVFIVLLIIISCSFNVSAQSSSDDGTGSSATEPTVGSSDPNAGTPATPPIESSKPPDKRLFGVVPNYRTANAAVPFAPITARHKLGIASRDSFDWPTYPLAALMTFMMPGAEETKAYGTGWSGFANRYARNSADQIIGNMLSEGILPSVLHEDPRYFRPGTGTFWSRLRCAMGQIVVTRKDSGAKTFNTPEFLGNAIAVGISNTYSPNLRTWGNSSEKLGLMIGTDMLANVIKEFGPDVKERVFHHRHSGT
jgi:hypothetical protein